MHKKTSAFFYTDVIKAQRFFAARALQTFFPLLHVLLSDFPNVVTFVQVSSLI